MRDIGSKLRAIILYVSRLLGLKRDPIKWWAIRVYISRLTGNFIPLPQTVPPCKWDPDPIPVADRTCNKQCTNPLYKDGVVNSAYLNGKEWYVCCPVGYSATVVRHPVTGEESVICKRG